LSTRDNRSFCGKAKRGQTSLDVPYSKYPFFLTLSMPQTKQHKPLLFHCLKATRNNGPSHGTLLLSMLASQYLAANGLNKE
jgi:hypothetical protein